MSDLLAGCAQESSLIHEPMAGTAPFALAWIAIEQPGPYGRDALLDSHFPATVGAQFAEQVASRDIKATLIRAAGPHADRGDQNGARQVWVASSQPARVMLGRTTIEDPAQLLDFDLDALVAGDLSAVAPGMVRDDQPLLLVCSHARRDVCCARAGRPIAVALANDPRWSGRVWETSHIGGHRFAATAIALPHGWVHGRLTLADAELVLSEAAAGRVSLGSARGRTCLPADAQVADLAVRVECGAVGSDGTRLTPGARPDTWRVATADFRRFEVTIDRVAGRPRRESCQKPAVDWEELRVADIWELTD